MTARALLGAAVGLAGCGVGGATSSTPAQLLVTEQYGGRPVAQAQRAAGGNVLDLLASTTRVRTGPRGAIASVNGMSGRWTVYINGIARAADPAHAPVHAGDVVWLDRHAPGAALRTRAVVGSFPEPFLHGRAGKRLPVRVECAEPGAPACAAVARRLTAAGVPAAQGGLQTSFTQQTLRVLVGPWTVLRADAAAALLGRAPSASGVYARFAGGGRTLAVLGATGATRMTLGPATGLVAATQLPGDQPVWVVTGTDARGVEQAARAFAQTSLVQRYALAVHADLGIPLPYPPNGGLGARPRR
jgi:hypothetical protein